MLGTKLEAERNIHLESKERRRLGGWKFPFRLVDIFRLIDIVWVVVSIVTIELD